MTIILFLVDTSASMNQRTYLGISLLDMTKGAVETFMKLRSRDPNSRLDRYMLLTFEDPPANVKAGWKESHATFIRMLKNLEANGLSTAGPALKNTFDLLNINRMQSGIDTYGQGRCPFYLEPAIIICITDGREMTSNGGVQYELNLPMNNAVPGSELTKEPFRWDQRLFGVVLRVPAVPPASDNQATFIPSADDAAIDAMCEVTGGRSYSISSQRMLMQCLESLVQKCQSGVVINFEKIGPDPPPLNEDPEQKNGEKKPTIFDTAWQNCRRMIYVQRSAQKGFFGHWPIPESFWPDLNSSGLAPRSAHPVVRFTCTPNEPMVLENLPFDKYELEPSPLTQYILERHQPNVSWQVFVSNSAKYSDIGHPFGYLKASSTLTTVNIGAPRAVNLSDASFRSCDYWEQSDWTASDRGLMLGRTMNSDGDELFKVHKLKPTPKWRQHFDIYLKTMPVYYAAPLRRALSRMGAQNLIPDQMDSCLSYSVVSYLKKLKNKAKEEYDHLVASVGQKVVLNDGIKVITRSQTSILQRKDFNQLLKHYGGDMSHLTQDLTDLSTFKLAVPNKDLQAQTYKNPFDIRRKNLLNQLRKMRLNFLHFQAAGCKLHEEENMHNRPVQDMGNYQEYLKRLPQPLRELEITPIRQHTFGNPFKVNKNLMIDEADEAMPGQQPGRKRTSEVLPPPCRPNKRKPGPLPKDIPARQLMSPTPEEQPEPPPGIKLNTNQEITTPNSIPHKPPDLNEDYDLNSGEDLEIVMITQDAEMNDTHDEEKNGRTSIPLVNHNHSDVKEPKIKAMKEKKIWEYNAHLRVLAVKELRKPGQKYDALFNYLTTIRGSIETKCQFMQDIIHEASRFKKHVLINLLHQYERTLIRSERRKKQKNDSNTPSR
ncbi:hypothetical protein LSH36_237g04058 [Paralvinella palmiformis]|uniref:VWFA domain-containing protein n=1 Tax=Paralvinella palmiformis TaxID=53620 RepID=A0AAD9N3N5_9ANNE|nr:hypothetical protein LSH36_237g04058 [Paralvinella palmiformis]